MERREVASRLARRENKRGVKEEGRARAERREDRRGLERRG